MENLKRRKQNMKVIRRRRKKVEWEKRNGRGQKITKGMRTFKGKREKESDKGKRNIRKDEILNGMERKREKEKTDKKVSF